MGRWKGLAAVAGFVLLAWMERRRPARRDVEPKLRRQARNLAIAGIGAVAVQFAEAPVVNAVASAVELRGWGVLPLLSMPRWIETTLAVILLDYSMYAWHVLMHRVPLFWRFHKAHHTDLDLDTSTALRFHFGELLLSVPWRVLQIAIIGTSAGAFSTWQFLFLLSIMFHHSEIELPIAVERRLRWFLITPHMHGIHHSVAVDETNSNWSSGLSLWDRLHGTMRCDVPHEITIGVPGYSHPDQVTLVKTLQLPFAG